MAERSTLHVFLGLHYILCVILLPSTVGLASTGLGAAGCSPSSCGQLRDIHYPFRLSTDPPRCGYPHGVLLCEDNRAILDLGSEKFFVTSIQYNMHAITVMRLGSMNGSCTLPFTSLTFGSPDDSDITYGRYYGNSACFMNCTRPVHYDLYWPVPCMTRNNSFAYVVISEYSDCDLVMSVEPSCGFLAEAPLAPGVTMNSTADIFELLQAFWLSWEIPELHDQHSFHITPTCLNESLSIISSRIKTNGILFAIPSLVESEMHFLACFKYYSNRGGSRKAELVIALIQIAQSLIAMVILCRFLFAPLSILLFLAYKLWSSRASLDIIEKFLRNQQKLSPSRYSYTDIIAITCHFREKLGQGGFGSVFKGTFLSGQHVAIKMLRNPKFNGEEFINEVATIGRIHHVNIVRLVGFCSDGSKRALVSEYMPNGSLDKYIFSERGTSNRPFSWEKLNEIALGVARGIDYLHRGCDMQILHFDIKPHNILLDRNFDPKISDFGLAKLYPKDYSLVSLSVTRGTIGYIAPELVSRNFGIVSDKSDVYSFGMLLLEMAGGRRNVDRMMENTSQVYYPSWIYDRLLQGEELEICNCSEIHEVERKLCKVGLWCIQMKSLNRPSMDKVVEMLEGDVDSLQMPLRPFFSSSAPRSVMLPSMNSTFFQSPTITEQEEISSLDE
uniref:Protein kinase domain-containing protein n=1 Tax=Ananas comosus var. bracteatus TaxID=296719 RepID=A0A6V7Q694_ANACO|nr:unnamed protein product [Ananas comosus var. bracteatus]